MSATKYGATAKWLHWLVGVIAIIMLIFGSGLEDMPLDQRQQIIMGHSGLGTLVHDRSLALAVVPRTPGAHTEHGCMAD